MQKPVGYPLLAGYYLLIYILMVLAVQAIVFALARWANFAMDARFMALLVPVMAAMNAGDLYVRRTGVRPSSGYMWTAALLFTVIVLGVMAALVSGLAALGLGASWAEIGAVLQWQNPESRQIVLAVLAAMIVLLFFMHRAAMWQGAFSRAKRAEYLRKRAAGEN